jgi:hypothetical protein
VSRRVSSKGRPLRTSGRLTSPTEAAYPPFSLLGVVRLVRVLGRVSRALREKLDVEGRPCRRLRREGGTRLEEKADGEAGGDGIARGEKRKVAKAMRGRGKV